MNEYEIRAQELIKNAKLASYEMHHIDLAILWCDYMIEEWQDITDNFVSGSVTNEYKLEYWQKVREILLQQKQAQDERES